MPYVWGDHKKSLRGGGGKTYLRAAKNQEKKHVGKILETGKRTG